MIRVNVVRAPAAGIRRIPVPPATRSSVVRAPSDPLPGSPDTPNLEDGRLIMVDSDTPPRTRPEPSAGPSGVRPGSALLRLETTESREGVLDGAWWPRSRDIGAELPALVRALTAHLGPVVRVGLDTAAWEGLPTRIVVDDRVVHIDSFAVGDDTVLITRADEDILSLLVVPPDATPEAAHAAMAQAVRSGNLTGAEQILLDTGGPGSAVR